MLLPPLLALSLSAADPGLDCSKAHAADEKLVCSDPALAKQDRELAARYEARLRSATPPQATELRKAQLSWLAERATCTRTQDGPPTPQDAARRCLETSYRWRIDDLSSSREPPRLPPGFVEKRIVRRDPRIRDLVDVSYPALAPGHPKAAAFDAFFENEARSRVDDAGEKPDLTDDPLVPETSLTADFAIPLATHRLVTVVTAGQEYGGGAHGMPFKTATTFDLERGRPLTLDDVFAKAAGIADALLPAVMKRLGKDASEWEGAEENARGVLEDATAWTFLADGAAVTFPPYAVGPYAAGSPEVHFSWAELKPYLRPDAPLPPR